MVTSSTSGSAGVWGLPVGRQQGREVVLVGHRRQPVEDVAQVREGILAVPLTGHDQRVQNGGVLTGVGMADEQPILLSDGRGEDRVFEGIVVDAGPLDHVLPRQRCAPACRYLLQAKQRLVVDVLVATHERSIRQHHLQSSAAANPAQLDFGEALSRPGRCLARPAFFGPAKPRTCDS